MITSDDFLVSALVTVDGETKTIDLPGLSALPRVGDEVVLDYWHGLKLSFVVDGIRHHISNVGGSMLQQTILQGRAS